MTTIKIAVTNLGKYNEGELVYEWLELPFEQEEFEQVLVNIGINEQYEEYFISDYETELPFKIGEYENIERLNEIALSFSALDIPTKKYNYYEVEEVLSFIYDLENEGLIDDCYEYLSDIVNSEDIDLMIESMLNNDNGWLRVKIFLQGANNTKDYQRLDGYGNLTELTHSHLENIMEEALEEVLEEFDL